MAAEVGLGGQSMSIVPLAWAELYNEQWLVERHGFKPPAQRRHDYYAAGEKMSA